MNDPAGWIALATVILGFAASQLNARRKKRPKTTIDAQAHALAEASEVDAAGKWQEIWKDQLATLQTSVKQAESTSAAIALDNVDLRAQVTAVKDTAATAARQNMLLRQHVTNLERAVRDLGGTVPPRPFGLDV